ncbi:MAG: 50S ribosomal protein L31 [Nitrosopumilus sp. H13]|nr:MAG: 50S ribosomal protein L31 [Nitrosopumilus sp. H13]
MSQEVERVYTINLGKVLLSQSQHRAVRAINMIKEFARHHMKTESIKIEEELAHKIWARGVRSPPRKIRVRMSKTDEGHILVSLYDEEAESKILADAEAAAKKAETKKADAKPDITAEPDADPAKEVAEPKVMDTVKEDAKPDITAEPESTDPVKEDAKPDITAEPESTDPVKEAESPKQDPKSEPAKEPKSKSTKEPDSK